MYDENEIYKGDTVYRPSKVEAPYLVQENSVQKNLPLQKRLAKATCAEYVPEITDESAAYKFVVECIEKHKLDEQNIMEAVILQIPARGRIETREEADIYRAKMKKNDLRQAIIINATFTEIEAEVMDRPYKDGDARHGVDLFDAIENIRNRFQNPANFENFIKNTKAYERVGSGHEDNFEEALQLVYGTHYDYLQQVKLLCREVRERYSQREAFEPIIKNLQENNSKIPGIIMDNLSISGSTYDGKQLTAEALSQFGLEPVHQVIGDGFTMYFSKIYEGDGKRPATVAYIQNPDHPGSYIPRTYYFSGSEHEWRFLPAYSVGRNGEPDWYNKGWGEKSIHVPIPFQKALDTIALNQEESREVENAKLAFYGCASFRSLKESYFQSVSQEPIKLDGVFKLPHTPEFEGYKIDPGDIKFNNHEFAPKMSDGPLTSWVHEWTDQGGSVHRNFNAVYPSINDEIAYVCSIDDQGRVCMKAAENRSKIGRTGLRKEWIDLGDLGTPTDEYKKQSGGWGVDQIGSKYVDMRYYLRQIPTIQHITPGIIINALDQGFSFV